MGFPKQGKQILVATSGGVDSMVLVSLLVENGFQIAVVHCNFQLRGEASDADEKLVRDWCSEHGISFHIKQIDTRNLVEETNSSIQMVAREERYAFFEELMKKHGYAATALAHHADDRVETLLINLFRGTGLRGLQGMPSKRDHFIRPLIGFTKKEIRAYAEKQGIPYREDASNQETYYQRNWIRLHVLPMLQEADSDAIEKLQNFCERVEEQLPNYKAWIKDKLSKLIDEKDKLSIAKLKNSKAQFTLLKEWLEPCGFSSDQVFEVIDIMNSSSGTEVSSATHRVIKDREHFILAKRIQKDQPPQFQFEVVERSSISTLKTPANVALIDANLVGAYGNTPADIASKFELRKWREGDRFKPLGMKSWKKLSDFFIDKKLSVIEKEQTWLLTYKEDIVWVVGIRLDDRFKISEATERVLKIAF